ncbi:MAG: hypothetical protein PXY39_07565 [archaeon]|nr:hypothetical protein [archaeon]
MVNLTISLSDETIHKLRKTVRERYGNRRGALSGLIEESLRQKLDVFEPSGPSQTFKALKNNHVLAEAENLHTLAKKLKELDVNPRSVRIVSSRKLAPIARTGARGRVP